MNITQAFDDEDQFRQLLRRIQTPVPNINHLFNEEGVNSARALADTRVKDLELSMTNVNRLFGSQTQAARRIYFAPVRMQRIMALAVYFKRCLDANRIPDIRIITLDDVIRFTHNMEIWTEKGGEVEDVIKQTKIEFSLVKFTKFREKLETLVSSIIGCRGISLNYLIRDPSPFPAPLVPIEDQSPDVNSLEFMKENTTHSGPEYEKDNQDLFTLLQSYLTGTDGWNVISSHQRTKDGRAAYLALRSHYEGSSFHDLIKSKANIMMTRTFYRGDTTKFTWEKFVLIHLEAHRMFEDVGEPLTESIKILHFKGGIRPEAGLESALDVARGLPNVNTNFDLFANHITEGVANCRSRCELFKSTPQQREVSALQRNNRGRGRGRGRGGRGKNFRGRGRGRGRSNYRPRNIPNNITVGGKVLYPNKTYSPEEYNSLSNTQKDELRRARNGNYNEPISASISAAITQGIREAMSSNEDISFASQTPLPTSNVTPLSTSDTSNVPFNVSAGSTSATDQFCTRRNNRE